MVAGLKGRAALREPLSAAFAALIRMQRPAVAGSALCRNQLVDGRRLPPLADDQASARRRASFLSA